MITINYQRFGTSGFQLRLRLYQEGETKFINVTKLLKGNIQRKHWNQQKQQFIPSCPFSSENNAILVQFRQRYDEMAINWTGSVYGMIAAMEQPATESSATTLSQYIHIIIGRLNQRKHPDGTIKGSFEGYEKLERRLQEFCKARKIQYDKLRMSDITPSFTQGVLDWVEKTRKGKGRIYISKTLHSVVMKADADGLLDAADFHRCSWVKKTKGSVDKFHTLTPEQCSKFATMDLSAISRSVNNELFRDFCLFILYTGQSVCDAVALRYSDIQNIGGVNHFVFKRRKIAEKQAVPCSVPISADLEKIMQRWERRSKDGYIFPFRSKETIRKQTTNNGDIKHLISKLNTWLKKVGKALGCTFSLHSYTFRHTAITHYISKGVPVIYVANMMGTSVENCEKIYYNNQGDISSRNKVMAAMSF